MKIMVTGAAGFLGHRLTVQLKHLGHDVVGVDRKSGDLTKIGVARDLAKMIKPEVIVHAAAKIGRLWCDDDPEAAYRDNVLMTEYVAYAAEEVGARMVYVSTSEVYGDHGHDELDETAVCLPSSGSYAKTKFLSEQACQRIVPERLQIIRPVMPYGPGVPPGRGRAAILNVLWSAHRQWPIVVHRGGERSWTYVDDIITGMAMAIESERYEIFNVGRDDDRISMFSLARLACSIAGASEPHIIEEEAPASQTLVKRLSSAKLRSLGWAPTITLRQGMTRTLDWIVANHSVSSSASSGVR